jgi:hypothetical protein
MLGADQHIRFEPDIQERAYVAHDVIGLAYQIFITDLEEPGPVPPPYEPSRVHGQ